MKRIYISITNYLSSVQNKTVQMAQVLDKKRKSYYPNNIEQGLGERELHNYNNKRDDRDDRPRNRAFAL